MPRLQRKDIESDVRKKVGGKDTLEGILKFVDEKRLALWGKIQRDDFIRTNTLLCLYKDLNGKGYVDLAKQTQLWSQISHNSLEHNTELIRPVLAQWGKKQIILGTLPKWNAAMADIKRPKIVSKANLLIDSTDFPLTTPRGTDKKKALYWSYKCKSLGRRFQAIFDGHMRCRAIFGGYSPKIRDSTWCEARKDTLETSFKGAVFVGDCHYAPVEGMNDVVTFITPTPSKGNTSTNNPDDDFGLTELQKKENLQIRKLRARVENPFGQIDKKWISLTKRWREKPAQLDHLVYFAFGLYNKNLK